jgi:hypothetical protein
MPAVCWVVPMLFTLVSFVAMMAVLWVSREDNVGRRGRERRRPRRRRRRWDSGACDTTVEHQAVKTGAQKTRDSGAKAKYRTNERLTAQVEVLLSTAGEGHCFVMLLQDGGWKPATTLAANQGAWIFVTQRYPPPPSLSLAGAKHKPLEFRMFCYIRPVDNCVRVSRREARGARRFTASIRRGWLRQARLAAYCRPSPNPGGRKDHST